MVRQVNYNESVCWLIAFKISLAYRNPTIKRPNRECDSFGVSEDYRLRYSLS